VSGAAPVCPRVFLATTIPMPHVGGSWTHYSYLMSGLSARNALAGALNGRDLRPAWAARGSAIARSLGSRDRYLGQATGLVMQRLMDCIRAKDRNGAARPDVVHTHDPIASWAVKQSVWRDIPLVQTVHGPLLEEMVMFGHGETSHYYRAAKSAQEQAFARVDHFIAVDTGQKEILLSQGVRDALITVIPNAVDLAALERIACASSPVTQKPYMLVPRRLVPKNGVEYVVRALRMIPSELRPRLYVAGDGALRQSLHDLAAGLGVADQIVFLGAVPREEVIGLAVHARAVLVPSVPASGVVEATSLAALEGMGLGRVVIASNIGGLAEVLSDGLTGILVRPGDPAAWAAAMASVMRLTNEQRRALGQRARDCVQLRFETGVWMAAIEGVYRQACARCRGSLDP